MASQYSTATAATWADRGNGRHAARQQDQKNVDANGPRAGEHDVKPHDITRNRTSSAASGAPLGSVHSNQGGNRGFLRNPPPPDGPRRAQAATETLLAAAAHARGNGTIAAVGAPCPVHWPDTARPPAVVTRAGPLPRRLYHSTAKEDAAERTTAHIPSADKSERGSGAGLAMVSTSNHAGPRTEGALTPKGQVPAAELLLRSGALWTAYFLLVQHRSSLITPPPLFQLLRGEPPTRLPFRRASVARGLAPSSRETGPQFRRD
jgi:hypothetical protein